MSDKVWTINVHVDSWALLSAVEGQGSWGDPAGSHYVWNDKVFMSAVSNDPNDRVVTGTADSFTLQCERNQTIKWIVSQINPVYLDKKLGVCMYGFAEGQNWGDRLTPPQAVIHEAAMVAVTTGFNASLEPSESWLGLSASDISVPETTVRLDASSGWVQYYVKLCLVDLSDPKNPVAKNFVQIDPSLHVVV
jgi:hypothetical protein